MVNNIESYDVDFKESMEMFLKDEKFQSILNFYLWECPVEGTSEKAKDFSFYGIKGKNVAKLKTRMLDKATESLRNNYEACLVVSDVEPTLDKMDVVPSNEFCVFYAGKESVRKIFNHIRNAFAHGKFYVIQCSDIRIFVFENKDKGKIKARMALQESTLLNWINCVRNFNKQEQE